MRLNADFSRRAIVVPTADAWVRSPAAGVERLMLDRIGEEVARATSLVRYAPESFFERHVHDEGEEFLVLEGTFSDERGDYPRGTYVRNPPGSSHAPFSRGGCRILVKLRQFDPRDNAHVVVMTDTQAAPDAWHDDILPLHCYADECVLMRRCRAGQAVPLDRAAHGTEILVVDGRLELEGRILGPESWLRFPHGDAPGITAVSDTVLWVKTGHLPA